MTRKPLPKVITRSSVELRTITGRAALENNAPARESAAHDSFEPDPVISSSAMPIANDTAPAILPLAQQFEAKRRVVARKIVERHRTYAAVGGLVPLPIANVAGVTGIILRMLKQLSDLYGVPFRRDRTRSIILGLLGGAAPTGLGVTTASALAFVMPGPALVGLAVSAITAGALTRGIGLAFIEHFEGGAFPFRTT